MNFISRFLDDRKLRFIGSVTTMVRYEGDISKMIYNLYESNKRKRNSRTHGGFSPLSSNHSIRTQAEVEAWKKGGPLPGNFVPTYEYQPPMKTKSKKNTIT